MEPWFGLGLEFLDHLLPDCRGLGFVNEAPEAESWQTIESDPILDSHTLPQLVPSLCVCASYLPYLKKINFCISTSSGDFCLEMVWGGPN